MPYSNAVHLNTNIMHENTKFVFETGFSATFLRICMWVESNEYKFVIERAHEVMVSFHLAGICVRPMCVFVRLDSQYCFAHEKTVVDASVVTGVQSASTQRFVVNKSTENPIDRISHKRFESYDRMTLGP